MLCHKTYHSYHIVFLLYIAQLYEYLKPHRNKYDILHVNYCESPDFGINNHQASTKKTLNNSITCSKNFPTNSSTHIYDPCKPITHNKKKRTLQKNIRHRKLTWNPKMEVWKRIILFNWVILRFQPLIFRGVPTVNYFVSKPRLNLQQHIDKVHASKGRNPHTKANKITPQLHTSTMGGKYLKVGEGNRFFPST